MTNAQPRNHSFFAKCARLLDSPPFSPLILSRAILAFSFLQQVACLSAHLVGTSLSTQRAWQLDIFSAGHLVSMFYPGKCHPTCLVPLRLNVLLSLLPDARNLLGGKPSLTRSVQANNKKPRLRLALPLVLDFLAFRLFFSCESLFLDDFKVFRSPVPVNGNEENSFFCVACNRNGPKFALRAPHCCIRFPSCLQRRWSQRTACCTPGYHLSRRAPHPLEGLQPASVFPA